MADCFSLPNAVELVEALRISARIHNHDDAYYNMITAADVIEQLVTTWSERFLQQMERSEMKDFAVETRYALMTGSITLSAEDFLHLVSERNAAVTDLEIVEDCSTCKYYDDMHADCIGYEWRGVANNESPNC